MSSQKYTEVKFLVIWIRKPKYSKRTQRGNKLSYINADEGFSPNHYSKVGGRGISLWNPKIDCEMN